MPLRDGDNISLQSVTACTCAALTSSMACSRSSCSCSFSRCRCSSSSWRLMYSCQSGRHERSKPGSDELLKSTRVTTSTPTCSRSFLLFSSSARRRSSSSLRLRSISSTRLFSSCSRRRCSRSCCLLISRSRLCCCGVNISKS